jgi:hypothetical protein
MEEKRKATEKMHFSMALGLVSNLWKVPEIASI